MTEQLTQVLDDLATELGVTPQNPGREAFFRGVQDGENQGPELSSGLSYIDMETQNAYDVGTYIGAAIWAAQVGKE